MKVKKILFLAIFTVYFSSCISFPSRDGIDPILIKEDFSVLDKSKQKNDTGVVIETGSNLSGSSLSGSDANTSNGKESPLEDGSTVEPSIGN